MSQFDNTPIGMPDQPASPPPAPPLSGNEQMMAIASIILGVVGLCAGALLGLVSVGIGSLCGVPFSIIGLILGYLALKDPNQKVMAIIGMALSGLTLIMICVLVVAFGGLILMGPAIGNVFSEINSSLQSVP